MNIEQRLAILEKKVGINENDPIWTDDDSDRYNQDKLPPLSREEKNIKSKVIAEIKSYGNIKSRDLLKKELQRLGIKKGTEEFEEFVIEFTKDILVQRNRLEKFLNNTPLSVLIHCAYSIIRNRSWWVGTNVNQKSSRKSATGVIIPESLSIEGIFSDLKYRYRVSNQFLKDSIDLEPSTNTHD